MFLLTSQLYSRGYSYGWGLDWTYILVLIGLGISLAASALVRSTYAKYDKVISRTGMTGAQAAAAVLRAAGVMGVSIEGISGSLTDHYDPRTKTLRLSQSTYGSRSVAAICVAAHECGHAVQDQEQYSPLVLRSVMVPAANIGSRAAWPVFLAGLFFSLQPLLYAGIILFSLAVLFSLITLPVEINASRRALTILGSSGLLPEDELTGGRKVLIAAALTYVAAFIQTALQLLRLILLSRRGRRR